MTLLGAIGLAMALVVVPDDGLYVMWKVVIPALPLLWLVVPGLWRNICPLSASNQTPRVLGLSKALTAPPWLKEYGFVIGAGLFIAVRLAAQARPRRLRPGERAAAARRRSSGGFVGGTLLKGKSGWCSSICPLLPVQRLYGQTPYKLVANSHCTPCVGCTKNCYDFNPKVAFLADLKDPDPYWSGYSKLFAAAFPGLVRRRSSTLPEARGGEEIAALYGQLALYLAASVGDLLRARLAAEGLHAQAHDAVGGGRLLALLLVRRPTPWPEPGDVGRARRSRSRSPPGWVLRTYAKERAFDAQAGAGAAAVKPLADLAAGRSMASHRALNAGAPEVTLRAGGQARRRQARA